LQRFARRFADFAQLPAESKRAVLSTLIKLHARLDVQFWKDLYHRHGDELAGSVYSGLFACAPNEALLFLPKIPDVQAMADALSLQLQRYTERLPPEERGAVVRKVQAALPQCSAALKLAIGEWFEEVGISAKPVPQTQRQTKAQRAVGLLKILTKPMNTELKPSNSRLAAAAA